MTVLHLLLIFIVLSFAGCAASPASRQANRTERDKATALHWQKGRLIQEGEKAGLFRVRHQGRNPELWLDKLASDSRAAQQDAARIVYEYHCLEKPNCKVNIFNQTGERIRSYPD